METKSKSKSEDDEEYPEEEVEKVIPKPFSEISQDTVLESEWSKQQWDMIEKTLWEIEEIKEITGLWPLKEQIIQEEVKLIQHDSHSTVFPKPQKLDSNEPFILKPDPIMRLNRCIGMNPRFCS